MFKYLLQQKISLRYYNKSYELNVYNEKNQNFKQFMIEK